MPFTPDRFAQKLRELRESLGASQASVSAATGIAQERLSELEFAAAEPTGDEVLILADHFRCDFGWLIEDDAVNVDDNVKKLFRFGGEKLSQADRYAINEFLFLCKSEALLEDLLELRPARQGFSFTPAGLNPFRDGERCAKAFREWSHLRSSEVIPDIFDWLRSNGIRLFRRALPDSKISGLFVDHPAAGRCILINYSEDPYRQRFSAAHEAGHALMDTGSEFNISEDADQKSNVQAEIRANTFASRFLMPPEMLRTLASPDQWRSEDRISKAAGAIRVSVPALLSALKQARIIDHGTRAELRDKALRPVGKREPELADDLSGKQLQRAEAILALGLNKRYVGHCFEAYRRGLISMGKLSECLLVDSNEVAEIADTFGTSINLD